MRRWTTVPVALALAVAGAAAVPAVASAATRPAAAQCAAGWGSLPKNDSSFTSNQLVNIRTGQNPCYDRLVFDVPGASDSRRVGYHVQYVDQLLQQGSGTPIQVKGGAVLEVVLNASAMDFGAGKPSYPGRVGQPLPGVDLTGYRAFTDAQFAGSFEGYTQLGVGVRARLPFRVFQLDDRLVVDVAHDWGATG